VKNNKRERKHPLTDKVEKAFRGTKKTETEKKYPSDDKPGKSSRNNDKFASGGSKYTGAGKKHKDSEKTSPRTGKPKSGTHPESRFTKSSKPTSSSERFGKNAGGGKGTGDRDRKPAFGAKPASRFGKNNGDSKRFDDRKDKPKRGDREAPKKYKTEDTKNPFNKKSESPKAKSFGKSKTPERYQRRTTTAPKFLDANPSEVDASGNIRLNRFISNSGVCSRRDADNLIAEGLVEVNGKVVTEMGYKVGLNDVVRYDGRLLKREQFVYLLLNKPKDFITTMDDPQERKTVMQLIAGACKERVYPVGRLDRNTTGLLLLTNDGELAEKLTHPSNKVSKVYQVELNKNLDRTDFDTIAEGSVVLEDGPVKVDEIAYGEGTKKIVGLQIHEGRNRIVRRLFEHLGYDVEKLDRTMYALLTKKDLPRGNWRFLTEKEVIRLKYQK